MADSDGAIGGHTILRITQILTLIPCWAILAALIDVYNKSNNIPPASILCLFIVALLASVWSFSVFITAMFARNTALWMTFFDFCFMAGLIAGVALLSNIVNAACVVAPMTTAAYTAEGVKVWQSNGSTYRDDMWGSSNHCPLARAAWGLGITNIILFFITAILAAIVYKQNREEDMIIEKTYAARAADPYTHHQRRHRHRHRSPRSGEYIVEERI